MFSLAVRRWGFAKASCGVADDRGVVGRVIQTGQPIRADAAAQPDLINRKVDTELGYRTRTVLAVPLRGKSDELFGVFELINKKSGAFTPRRRNRLDGIGCPRRRGAGKHPGSSNAIVDQPPDRRASRRTSPTHRSQPKIEALRSIVRRVADTELAVLILGENGTGKEVVAQSIHYLSSRRDKPFVALNCAAIPDTLAESELFGHEKGAFTDAHDTRRGASSNWPPPEPFFSMKSAI